MIANKRLWLACAAMLMIGWHGFLGEARAQQPSAAALASARELVEIKGGSGMFDPIITGMVEQTKAALLRTSPQLNKELSEVAAQLATEFAPRRTEIIAEAAKFYAIRFSEQELKDIVIFYKTAVGKKMLALEPQVLDATFGFVQQVWGPRVSEEVMVRFRAEMKKKGHDL